MLVTCQGCARIRAGWECEVYATFKISFIERSGERRYNSRSFIGNGLLRNPCGNHFVAIR